MQFLVAVNCSATKTVEPERGLLARGLPRGPLEGVSCEWRRRRGAAVARYAAGSLYAGRSFRFAMSAAARLSAEFKIVSAGMGLLSLDTPVPSYGLTISKGPDCILARGSEETPFTAAQWWSSCARASDGRNMSFHRLLDNRSSFLIVLALTQPYLKMVAPDLACCSPDILARLRIVGNRHPHTLPEVLQPLVMPYDDRLNDPDFTIQGTAFDYAARALLHFSELVRSDRECRDASVHARRVRQSLAHRRAPVRPVRERIDDRELGHVVRKLKREGLSCTAALMRLRRTLLTACQAERFAKEWREA